MQKYKNNIKILGNPSSIPLHLQVDINIGELFVLLLKFLIKGNSTQYYFFMPLLISDVFCLMRFCTWYVHISISHLNNF